MHRTEWPEDAPKFEISARQKTIFERALERWGRESQIRMTIEEAAELIVVLIKFGREINGSTLRQVASEMADVDIMLSQLMYFSPQLQKLFYEERNKKIERLEQRLEEG